MILLQDQFDDIIGKSDLDNLNQISIYHNSNSRNSNKYYDDSNKCYDISQKTHFFHYGTNVSILFHYPTFERVKVMLVTSLCLWL